MNELDINPMDWHNTRVLNYIPKHFVTVKFTHNDKKLEVLSWLQEHTVGRFGIELSEDKDEKNSVFSFQEKILIGFEDPAEATMYSMFYR
jgi:hypothetical protein